VETREKSKVSQGKASFKRKETEKAKRGKKCLDSGADFQPQRQSKNNKSQLGAREDLSTSLVLSGVGEGVGVFGDVHAPAVAVAGAGGVASVAAVLVLGRVSVGVRVDGLGDDLVGDGLAAAGRQALETHDGGQHHGQQTDQQRLAGQSGDRAETQSSQSRLHHHQTHQQSAGALLVLAATFKNQYHH
jgi:hypothetical protein